MALRITWARAADSDHTGPALSVQTYYEVVARAKPYPSLGDLGYLAFYPVALAALLRLPVARRSSRDPQPRRTAGAHTPYQHRSC